MKYNTKRTELPITILTDYEHRKGDVLESVRQQIEQSGFHLQTLFNNLKRSALFMEKYFDDNAPDEVRGFCSDLMNTADVGNALCMNVWRATSELTEIQMNENPTSEIETPKSESPIVEIERGGKSDALSLAEKISHLILSDKTPLPISDGFASVINEFYNNEADQSLWFDFANSPENIARILECSTYYTVDGERAMDVTEGEDDENL